MAISFFEAALRLTITTYFGVSWQCERLGGSQATMRRRVLLLVHARVLLRVKEEASACHWSTRSCWHAVT